MSLRRQNLSPTANLLRNSRLFSLPNPLPRPLVVEPYGSGSIKASDSATLPYPTHQAIATTPSSLARGDWGLKRPLPSRSHLVQTSNPVLRVKQWDTIEHVTDFESAADHVRTRQKFEQMGVPMMKGMSHFGETDLTVVTPKSAFERQADVTAYDSQEGLDGATMYLQALKENVLRSAQQKSDREHAESGSGAAPSTQTYTPPSLPAHAAHRRNLRWKHEGPWLPGMSATDFTAYIAKVLSHRRAEFNTYLVEHVKSQIYTARRQSSKRNENMPLDPVEAEMYHAEQEKQWSNITQSDIDAGIRTLRAQCATDPLSSNLVKDLIIPFLRLPPIGLKSTMFSQDQINEVDGKKFSDDTTPSSTHPSAGLGYLRTKGYMSNHPILGPQALPSPITARVVQPRKTGTTTEARARLGVAGFVADDEYRNTAQFTATNKIQGKGVESVDLDTEGGAKVYVQPRFASVSPDGRVHIKVARSHGPELAVSRGQLEDRPPQRENVEARPLEGLDLGASGVPELDQLSSSPVQNQKAGQLMQFLASQQRKEAEGRR